MIALVTTIHVIACIVLILVILLQAGKGGGVGAAFGGAGSQTVFGGRGALKRKVRLFDSPGAEIYTKTVAELIQQEIDHAEQHLSDVRKKRLVKRGKK